MFDVICDINKFVNFVLVKGHSDKKNKDYYGIAIKINNDIHIIKFLTTSQANAIIKMKGGNE